MSSLFDKKQDAAIINEDSKTEKIIDRIGPAQYYIYEHMF